MKKSLLLMLAACNGWGDTLDPVNHVPGVNDAVWHSEVSAASDIWRDSMTEGCYPFHIAVDGECGNHVTLVPRSEWDHDDKYNGVENTSDGDIDIIGDSPYNRRPILLHELGHAMGLDHDLDTNSIMHPTSHASLPTWRDVRNAESALGCR